MLSICWILLLGWIAFFCNLGNTGLIDETEPLFAEAARQMTVTGDWITPYFNGLTRFDKPPLVYWLMAFAYKTIGVNEWAVRLPSALAAYAITSIGFYTLRYFGITSPHQRLNHRSNSNSLWFSASIGAAIIALNPITIIWARIGVSDMLLSGCIVSALFCFFIGYAEMGNRSSVIGDRMTISPWYLAFYILVGLAILTKGPVGIVLPALIIGSFLVYLGNFSEVWREMRPLWGLAIVSAIAIPWYVLVILSNGEDYINSFFGYHNLERFTSVVNHHSAPWYFYFLVILLGFAPWSSYLPLAIAQTHFWERKNWQKSPRASQLSLFAFFWFTVIFIFFTIAVTKLPHYILPAIPAAAILVTGVWNNSIHSEEEFPPKQQIKDSGLLFSGLFNLVLALTFSIGIFISPSLLGYDPAAPNLTDLFQQSGIPIKAAIIWGLTAVGIALLLQQKKHWLWSINLVGFAAFVIFAITPGYFLVDRLRQMPLRELAAQAIQQQKPGEELIMVGFKKPSLVFYTQRPVTFFPNFEFALYYIQQNAAKKPPPPSVLILAQYNKTGENFLLPNEYKNLGQSGSYRLIRLSKKPFL